MIEQQLPTITPDIRSSLCRVVSDYLKQIITYNQAHAVFLALVGASDPIDRLREILEVPDESIPFTGEEDEPNNPNMARRKMRTWSSYEDTRLLAGIYRYGVDNWAPISKFVGNGRTRAQCAQRWARGLNPRICKDTWDPKEDMRLLSLVQQFGDKAWTRISASLGNRSDVQCRYHYHQLTKDMSQIMQIHTLQASFSNQGGGQQPSAFPTISGTNNATHVVSVRPNFASQRQAPRFSMPVVNLNNDINTNQNESQLMLPPNPNIAARRSSHYIIPPLGNTSLVHRGSAPKIDFPTELEPLKDSPKTDNPENLPTTTNIDEFLNKFH